MEKSDTTAADILADYNNYREERYRRVAEHRAQSRVKQFVSLLLRPKLREEVQIVEAFESVPAARLSAAQNEGYLIVH